MSQRSTGTSRCKSRGERVLRGAVLLAVAVIPCAVLPYWRDTFVAPKLALAGAASLLAAAALAASGRLRLAASRVDAPLCAFAAAVLAASAASMDPWLSWFGGDRRYTFGVPGLAVLLAGVYLGCALRRAGDGEDRVPAGISRSLCAGSVVVSVLALVERMDWTRLVIWGEGNRHYVPISTIGNNVSLGLYLAMALPAAWSLCRRGGADRVLGSAAFFLGACGLGIAGSRSAVLAAAVGAAVYRWWTGAAPADRREDRGEGLPRPLLLAAVACAAFLLVGTLWLRVTLGHGFYAGSRGRVWLIALRIFLAQPWLGSGPGTFRIAYQMRQTEPLAFLSFDNAHDDWLEVLATAGIVGTATYAWLHVCALKALLEERRRGRSELAPLAAGLAVFLLCVKLNPPNIGIAWIAAVMAGALLAGERETRGLGPGPFLLAAGAVWLCLCSARTLAGDFHCLLGRRENWEGRVAEADSHFRRAISWRPEATAYRVEEMNVLWAASDYARDPEDRLALLLRAEQASLDGLRLRPLDGELYRLLGLAELHRYRAGEAGRLAPARTALDSALRLDPFNKYALAEMAEVAGLQGDLRAQRAAKELLARGEAAYPIGI